MVPRFNCRHDGGMFEEEGGQYVDAEDYDEICNFVKDCFATLTKFTGGTREVLDDMDYTAKIVSDLLEGS